MTPNLKFALENRQKVAVSLLVVNSHESGAGCESIQAVCLERCLRNGETVGCCQAARNSIVTHGCC